MARRRSRKWLFGGGAVVVVVVGIAWVLFSPLLFDDVVEEAFPGVPTREGLAAMDQDRKDEIAAAALAAATAMPDHAMAEAMPVTAANAEPVLVAQGAFADADAVHRGSGRAGIYRVADGGRVLRLEDLRVTNGPDLHIVLARSANPQSSTDVRDDYFDLGVLKGNVGNQNYAIPADVDLSRYGSVVVWCKAFRVLFSAAPLKSDV